MPEGKPRDNWQLKEGRIEQDYIPEEKEYLHPGSGQGDTYSNFIPDEAWLRKQKYQITPEQEKYGIEWKPGDPEVPPAKRRRGGLNPISGEWIDDPEAHKPKSKRKK